MGRVVAAVSLLLCLLFAVRCGGGRADGPNVLLVTIETFRADHFGAKRDGIDLTPELVKCAERGARFSKAYAAASFTLPSLCTLATGEPPPVHGVRFWTDFGKRYQGPTLTRLFADKGYATGFIYSANTTLRPYEILQRGWDEKPTEFILAGPDKPVDADMLLPVVRDWLAKPRDRPFFLWVHLFDPHTPYGPADRFVEGLADLGLYHRLGKATFDVEKWVDKVPGGRGAQFADALYAADIRAADDAVGQLLADLDMRGIAAKTVVCVTSDHGENLSMDPEPRWDHGISCDEQLLRVPLIFSGPGVPVGRVDESLVRHLDVPPTLLGLAGIDPPSGWRGRDLFGTSRPPRYVIGEGTIATYKKSPFYSVTDGEGSLRIFTSTAPARLEWRDERKRGSMPVPVNVEHPTLAAQPALSHWNEEMNAAGERSLSVNRAGDDHEDLTPEQRKILEAAGLLK
jgi:arylsulfatase A-like enzyme